MGPGSSSRRVLEAKTNSFGHFYKDAMLRLANLVTTFILIFQTSSEPFIGFSSPTDQRVSIQNGDPLARSIFAVVYLIFKNLYQLLENGRFHEEIHVFQFFKAKI